MRVYVSQSISHKKILCSEDGLVEQIMILIGTYIVQRRNSWWWSNLAGETKQNKFMRMTMSNLFFFDAPPWSSKRRIFEQDVHGPDWVTLFLSTNDRLTHQWLTYYFLKGYRESIVWERMSNVCFGIQLKSIFMNDLVVLMGRLSKGHSLAQDSAMNSLEGSRKKAFSMLCHQRVPEKDSSCFSNMQFEFAFEISYCSYVVLSPSYCS